MLVVMSEVLDEHLLEVTAAEDEESVEALSTNGAYKALGEGVRPRGSDRGLDDLDAFGPEHLVEAGRKLGVSISDQERDCSGAFGQDNAEIARLLGHPLPYRVGRDAGHVHLPGLELYKEQHVDTPQKHRVDGEESRRPAWSPPALAGTPTTWDPIAVARDRCRGAAGWPTRSRAPVGRR